MTRVGVVTFPGSLDDGDARRAVRLAGAEPVRLWHGDHDLQGVDAVVLPGGFSYGDYLRCGAIAARSPIMTEVDRGRRQPGMPVLGICNGFQMLTEAHLLPGGLVRNDHGAFVCRDQRLRVEQTATAWTNAFEAGEEIVIPLKNGEGGYVADADTVRGWRARAGSCSATSSVDPNGSVDDIAGIANERGQRRRSDAASGARGRAGLRAGHPRRDALRRRRPAGLHARRSQRCSPA